MAEDVPLPPSAQRQQHERADGTRQALLDAALTEFSSHGFTAASTRRIAQIAGSKQPQINYHFDSKESLWRATVDRLFERLDQLLADETGQADEPELLESEPETAIRRMVRAVSQLPELNRIMIMESTSDSDRLRWLVEKHARHRFELVAAVVRDLAAPGTEPMNEAVFYFSFIGAISLPYVCAPEARLYGHDPSEEEFITAHADAIVRLFLGQRP